jgi:polyisoprenoid-binding protein YceI
MNRKIGLPVVIVIAVVSFGLGAGAGIVAWLALWSGDGQASVSAQERAPQLSLGAGSQAEATEESAASSGTSSVPAPRLSLGDPTATPTQTSAVVRLAKRLPDADQQQTPLPAGTPTPTPTPTPAPVEASITRGLYRINSAASLVSFTLQEDLRGQRIDVIGTTRDVGGDFIVDFVNPSASVVGQIVINARTLQTDNSFRNQAIRSEILKSAQAAYEFITFTPTSLAGLGTTPAQPGSSIAFQINGDLTIVDTTLPVTFDAVVTADEQIITGTAETVVRWADFGLRIPSVPGVSNITDEVTLAISFSADLVEAEGASAAVDFSQALFRINDQSLVSFTLQEDLRGQRIDVVGTTNQVGGDIIVDAVQPENSIVGQIVINARTLQTDNSFRNQAIRSEILKSAQAAYEFITFTPTAITGLEGASVAIDAPLTFQITGDLKIVDTTLPVTFDVEATINADKQLTGTATTVVRWADFGLRIPNVPGVSNITDEVTLAINFVADVVEQR